MMNCMIRYISLSLFCIFSVVSLGAKEFTVATYNVENLFDLQNNHTEYREYKPYSKYWNKKSLKNKLNNITKVIIDLNADILALQEIETKQALNLLQNRLKQKNKRYKYSYFLKNRFSAIGVALLSRYPIVETNKIVVNKRDK